MCVIIHKPAGVVIPDEDYILAHDNNQDGLGLMYKDETGKFITEHYLDTDIDTILVRMDALDKYNVLIHFRYTTVGETIFSQCHPFEVLRKTAKRPAIHMMHNGTFDSVPLKTGENDSQAFIRHFLKPVLSVDYTRLYDKDWLQWVDSMAGWSKLAFMDSKGKISKTGTFTSRKGYVTDTSYFVSNTYSFQKDYRKTKPKTAPHYNSYNRQDDWPNYSYGGTDAYSGTNDHDTYGDNVYTFGGEKYSTSALKASMIQKMSITELIQWIKDEPTDAYNMVIDNCPTEAGLYAEEAMEMVGDNADIYSWVLYHPENVAELLEEWSYL